MDAIYIGIDVSKDRLDVATHPGGESFAVGRNGAGIDELIERLRAISPRVIAIEATGGFERIVAAGLAGAELPVVVVNPAHVRSYADGCPRQTCQDRSDRCHGDREVCQGDQASITPVT